MNLLQQYGIKEVADFQLYTINADGTPGKPVLYLDTLKVSTVETTAQTADARGGKGNPKLVSWDYSKDITLSLEDALFSPKSMAVMLGNGSVTGQATGTVERLYKFTASGTTAPTSIKLELNRTGRGVVDTTVIMSGTPSGDEIAFASTSASLVGVFNGDGTEITTSDSSSISSLSDWNAMTLVSGDDYLVKLTVPAVNLGTITVGANTFPGTYYAIGDTFVRSSTTGEDEMFKIEIPKCKMTCENTLTLQADGDPATFNATLNVLDNGSGELMKLTKYALTAI